MKSERDWETILQQNPPQRPEEIGPAADVLLGVGQCKGYDAGRALSAVSDALLAIRKAAGRSSDVEAVNAACGLSKLYHEVIRTKDSANEPLVVSGIKEDFCEASARLLHWEGWGSLAILRAGHSPDEAKRRRDALRLSPPEDPEFAILAAEQIESIVDGDHFDYRSAFPKISMAWELVKDAAATGEDASRVAALTGLASLRWITQTCSRHARLDREHVAPCGELLRLWGKSAIGIEPAVESSEIELPKWRLAVLNEHAPSIWDTGNCAPAEAIIDLVATVGATYAETRDCAEQAYRGIIRISRSISSARRIASASGLVGMLWLCESRSGGDVLSIDDRERLRRCGELLAQWGRSSAQDDDDRGIDGPFSKHESESGRSRVDAETLAAIIALKRASDALMGTLKSNREGGAA